MRDIEINSVADLFEAKDFMLQTQSDIKISKIGDIEYKIKLDGGRFNDFDLTYIDAGVARVVLEYQAQYENFIAGLEQKFNIQIPQSQRMLKFKLEKGCLEISTDIKDIFERGAKTYEWMASNGSFYNCHWWLVC